MKKIEEDRETTEGEEESALKKKCPHAHDNYGYTYSEEWDSRYFGENAALHNVKCAECNVLVTDEDREGVVMPTMAQSVFVCWGRNHYDCNVTLCNKCYNKKMISETISMKRKTRSSRAA